MACGGCGGYSLRKQQVQRPEKSNKQRVIQQRVIRNNTSTVIKSSGPKDRSVSLKRQSLVRDDRCVKCGHPVMLVNIAGRERKQCTSCKSIQT